MRKPTLFAAAALAGALLSACGEDQAAEQQESATRELQQARRELQQERRRLKREREKQESSADSSPSEEPTTDGSAGSGEEGKVPDVEGKDHQLAQDTLQAAGFYNISEEDASGQERPLIFDRNWTVVSQSPDPGTRASLDRTIVLRAQKDWE